MRKLVLIGMALIALLIYGCGTNNYAEEKKPQPIQQITVVEEASNQQEQNQVIDEEQRDKEIPPITDQPATKPEIKEEPKTVEIEIKDFKFNPKSIVIKKGTTVKWTQLDSVRHTVTSDDDEFDSNLLSKGETFSHTFNEAGTFSYHCRPHPYMKGVIEVE